MSRRRMAFGVLSSVLVGGLVNEVLIWCQRYGLPVLYLEEEIPRRVSILRTSICGSLHVRLAKELEGWL